MVRFCPLCDNLLQPGLKMLCTACGTEFPVDPDNNMVGEYTKPREQHQYITMIEGAAYDPARSTIYQICKKCKEQITYLTLGEAETPVFVCKCGTSPDFELDQNLLIKPQIEEPKESKSKK